jgi:hypothetical protein
VREHFWPTDTQPLTLAQHVTDWATDLALSCGRLVLVLAILGEMSQQWGILKLKRLTPAQFRVIALLWHEEMDYEGIAYQLGIRVRTVRKHIEDVATHLPGQGPSSWRVLGASPIASC